MLLLYDNNIIMEGYEEAVAAIQQADAEWQDYGVPADTTVSGTLVGTTALLGHLNADDRDALAAEYGDLFSPKDVDIYTDDTDAVDTVATETPYGVALPDRSYGGGIYALDESREPIPADAGTAAVRDGAYGDGMCIDILDEMTVPPTGDAGVPPGMEGLTHFDLQLAPWADILRAKAEAGRPRDRAQLAALEDVLGDG